LAEKLSKRLGCPYVMDYRDPWTQNPHKRAALSKRIREEARLLAGSAAVTIVSQSWAKTLDRQHRLGSKLHVITNGYDPEELADIKPLKFDHFAIVYAGRFYPPKRVITPVMQALKFLKEEHRTSAGYFFHYYGPHHEHVRTEADRSGVSDLVVLHGEVSQSTALAAVRGANVAVVITSVGENSTPDDQGIVTGKIFEPISMNVPILLISPTGSDAEDVLRKGGPGKAFRSSDIGGIAGFLSELLAGQPVRPGQRADYSWANIGRRLDGVLRQVLDDSFVREMPAFRQI
jgi:glycosyltransferase involved in cell wall biosynthesis